MSRKEFGHVLLPGTEDEHMKVNGSFSYLGPDGVFYEVRYTADDQGFHPEGDHIKVPPFVPWIHRHGQQPESDSNAPAFSNLDYGTTPKPTTQYLPSYATGENRPNYFSTTSKPTTQYLPQASQNPNYIAGASNLNTLRPRPTVEYLPTSPSAPIYGNTEGSAFSSNNPDPEITIFSTPKPQTLNY